MMAIYLYIFLVVKVGEHVNLSQRNNLKYHIVETNIKI